MPTENENKSDTLSGVPPQTACSASEYLAAAKFLRELLAELDIEEEKKSRWWSIWGTAEARRHYAIAVQHAEDLARERMSNTEGLGTGGQQ